MEPYIPRRGDFIALTFDPQSGHEQRGHRPALVISHGLFNEHTGLAIVCPVPTTDCGFPFPVKIADQGKDTGFVMAEQIKSIDFRARRVKRVGKASSVVLDEVLSILDACLY